MDEKQQTTAKLSSAISGMRASGKHPAAVVLSAGVRKQLGADGARTLIVAIADGRGGSLNWTLMIVPTNAPEPTMRVMDQQEFKVHLDDWERAYWNRTADELLKDG